MPVACSRRSFLRCAATACAAYTAMGAEQQPFLSFPTAARSRLAVTSYPFRAYIESPTNSGRKRDLPGMDLTAFPGMVAEKFGVFNINPLGDHFRSTEPAYLSAFRGSLETAHSHIVDLGLGGRELYSRDEPTRKAAVD